MEKTLATFFYYNRKKSFFKGKGHNFTIFYSSVENFTYICFLLYKYNN